MCPRTQDQLVLNDFFSRVNIYACVGQNAMCSSTVFMFMTIFMFTAIVNNYRFYAGLSKYIRKSNP